MKISIEAPTGALAMSDAPTSPAAATSPLRALLRQAKAGDRKALEALILAYQDQVLRLAVHLLGDIEDAKDAAQEALLRFCRYLSRFDDERRLTPWLYSVVVNVCRDAARQKRKRATVSLNDPRTGGALAESPSAFDLEAESQRAEQRRILEQALKSLSEKERAAVVLRDLEGLPTKEVAEILGSSETTVRSQISTARVKIKKFRDRWVRREK